MGKNEMVLELLETLREQRHKVYVDNLSRIFMKVDEGKREKFVQVFHHGIERAENLAMEQYHRLFNGFSENALRNIFLHPIVYVFGQQYMPTFHNIDAVIRTAVHVVTCPKRGS